MGKSKDSDKEQSPPTNKSRNNRAQKEDDQPPPKKKKVEADSSLTTKTGGAYIPPAKLRMMQQQMADKNSEQYQRLSWEALKKSINGLINKVNVSNIKDIVRELFQENIVRGRGLLARSIITAQNASPTFTHVYAALVAIINTRFPQNGELILRRVVSQFRKSYRRNQKDTCLHCVQFIAHLVNQQVAHEILALQILTLLLETPTDDSVEVAIGFLKECGQKLGEVTPRGLVAVFERLRVILHEEKVEKRVQYMMEVMFAIRKDGFKEHPSIQDDLALVDESDQITHMLTLDDDNVKDLETQLNVFRLDSDFQQSEENYKQIKKEILDESSEGSDSSGSSSSSDSEDNEEGDEAKLEITDRTETNLVALRRTIYLAVQSSLSFEECAHKILKMEFEERDYPEICAMIVDCCSQLRTYEKFFGLLGGRFCLLRKEFMECFERLFAQQYETIHRLETNKLRNVAKFFAHLVHSDSIPWSVLSNIVLSEDTTTSSSRIFIKILFQEITEYVGITKLNERLKDPTLAPFFEGLFPRDNPRNTRFSINFFTSIGLGGITDELREHLKTSAQLLSQKLQQEQLAALNAESSSSSDESSEDDSSSQDSSSEDKPKKKSKKSRKHKKKSSKKAKKSKKQKKRKKLKKAPTPSSASESESSASDEESDDEEKEKRTRRGVKDLRLDRQRQKPERMRSNVVVVSRDSRSNLEENDHGNSDNERARDTNKGHRDSNRDRDAGKDYRDSNKDERDSNRDHHESRNHRDSNRDHRDSTQDYRDSKRDHRDSNKDRHDRDSRSDRDHTKRSDDHNRRSGDNRRSNRDVDEEDEYQDRHRDRKSDKKDRDDIDEKTKDRDNHRDERRRRESRREKRSPTPEKSREKDRSKYDKNVADREDRRAPRKRRDVSSDSVARVRGARKGVARKQRSGSVSSSVNSSTGDSDQDDRRRGRRERSLSPSRDRARR